VGGHGGTAEEQAPGDGRVSDRVRPRSKRSTPWITAVASSARPSRRNPSTRSGRNPRPGERVPYAPGMAGDAALARWALADPKLGPVW